MASTWPTQRTAPVSSSGQLCTASRPSAEPGAAQDSVTTGTRGLVPQFSRGGRERSTMSPSASAFSDPSLRLLGSVQPLSRPQESLRLGAATHTAQLRGSVQSWSQGTVQ